MSGLTPRLVLNRSGATSTNAIHRVLWKRDLCPKQIVVSFLSSITQLSCEIEGRFYGGGVLKLEPSDAARVLVPLLPAPVTDKQYKELHKLCIEGKHAEATRRVDALFIQAGLISQTQVNRIRKEIKRLRSRRLSGL
jgi:adenine-specific DNA-methyltransferase